MTLTQSDSSTWSETRSGELGTATTEGAPSYDPRRWRALPVVLSATFMSLFDIFVVNVAAPSIQRDLHASSATLELVVAGYSFSYAAGLVTGARLGDLVGRRRMFTIGLAVFAAASLLSGIAPTSAILVVGRLAQGFGAAAMVPQVLSLLTANFRPDERPRVFSLFGVTVGLGTVAGQILGGVLLHFNLFGWGWRPIFLVNVPIGIVAIVLARRLLPESRPDVADRLDPLGVVLLTTGVGAITAPLVLGQAEHWPLWTWASFVAGAVLVGSFLWWENRLGQGDGHPLLPLSLFEHRAFNVGLLVNLGFFSFFGSVLLTLTIFLQEGLHFSPMRAGLTFAPLGVAFALSSLRGRSLHAQYGTVIISVGAATALLGVVGLAIVVGMSGLSATALELSPALALIGVGNGLVIPLIVSGVLQSVPSHGNRGRLGGAHHHPAVLDDVGHRRGGHAVLRPPSLRRRRWRRCRTHWWPTSGLVAFAFAMTVLLARKPSVATDAAPAPDGVDGVEYALADEAMG